MTKLTIFLWVVLFTYSCQKNELNGGLAISEKSMPQFVLPTQITAGSESNFSPDISKDGRYLVFTSDRSVNKDLWKKDLRGGSAYKLSFHAADDFSPVLSADGKKIAFVSRRNDASGDIHIMHFGWSWKSLFNHSGENVDRVKAPNIEEQDPAWYPDGKRIIFTSRTPGTNTPQIMTANLKDLKAVPLENLYGHQPKVSPDGKQIVYVSKGNIYHFDEVSRKITALTDNDKVINGQPSFSEDGRSIYFIRYLADTNQDREINGNDVATIWKLDIPTQMNKEYKENFSMQPITNGGFSAYFPKPRGNNLYFTQENELGLDVFRLPIEGHFHSDLDLNSVVFQAKNRISIDEQIFILRAAQSKSYRLGRHSDVGELVYREMEILVDNGRWIEADWLLKKIKANLPAQTEAIQLCELSFLRLKLSRFVHFGTERVLSKDDEREIRTILSEFEQISSKPIQISHRLHIEQEIMRSQIFVSLRMLFKARDIMLSLIDYKRLHGISTKKDEIFYSKIMPLIADKNSVIENYQTILASPNINEEEALQAARDLVEFVANFEQPHEALSELTSVQGQDPRVRALARLKAGELFLQKKNDIVASNEFKLVLRDSAEVAKVSLSAANHLYDISLRTGRFDDLEELLFHLRDTLSSREDYQQQASRLLNATLIQKARVNASRGQVEDALSNYLIVNTLNPGSISALRGVIELANVTGDGDRIRREFIEDAEVDSKNVSKQYGALFAKTFELSQDLGPGKLMSLLSSLIDEFEELRDLDDQNRYTHLTLGWLYFQKGYWQDVYLRSGDVLSNVLKKWKGIRDFFGATNVGWYEKSIESLLTAYFLAPQNSIVKSYAAQNLAQSYYRLKNYPKALDFYLVRIRALNANPIEDVKVEAQLYERAGRSAFHSDKHELGIALQKKSLEIWQKENNTEKITYALDTISLSYLDGNLCSDAMGYYESLISMNRTVKNRQNLISSLISQSICQIKIEKFNSALSGLDEAENLILQSSSHGDVSEIKDDNVESLISQTKGDDSAIKIALGGQSDAKGFDDLSKLILIQTYKIQIFRDDRNRKASLQALKNKINLLNLKRKHTKIAGAGKTYLQEEIVFAMTELGKVQIELGDFDAAQTTYGDLYQELKVSLDSESNLPSALVIQALLDRVISSLVAYESGMMSEKDLEPLRVELDEVLQAFIDVEDRRSQNDLQLVARMYGLWLLLEEIVPLNDTSPDHVRKNSREEWLTRELKSAKLDSKKYSSFLLQTERSYGDDSFAHHLRQLRKRIYERPEKIWKFLASQSRFSEAYKAAESYIKTGGSLGKAFDRYQFTEVFNGHLKQLKEPKFADIGSYFEISLQEKINRSGLDNASVGEVATSLEIGNYSELAASLTADEAIVMVYLTDEKRVVAGFLDRDHEKVRSVQNKKTDLMLGAVEAISDFNLGSKNTIYFSVNLPFGSPSFQKFQFHLNQAHPQLNYSFLPAPSLLPVLSKQAKPGRYFISQWGGENPVVAAGHERLRVFQNDLSDPKSWAKQSDFMNIFHFSGEFYADSDRPGNSYWIFSRGPKDAISTQKMYLKDFYGMKGLNANTIVMNSADVGEKTTKFEDDIFGFLLWIFSSSGFSSVVINHNDKDKINWQMFYEEIGQNRPDITVKGRNFPLTLYGFRGLDLSAGSESHGIERYEEESEDFADEKKWMEAVQSLTQVYALEFNEGNDRQVEILTTIKNHLFMLGRYKLALDLHLEVIRNHLVKDSESYGDELLVGAVLAVESENFVMAQELLSNAIKIFQARESAEKLAKGYFQHGIMSIRKKEYEQSVEYFKKAREYFLEDDDEDKAAEMLWEIVKVYQNFLNDYPSSLMYIEQAELVYKELGDQKRLVSLVLEKALIFIRLGQHNQAISILSSLEKTKSDGTLTTVQGILADQYAANALYLSGQRARALNSLDRVFQNVKNIDSKLSASQFEIDGLNLTGLIKAKEGLLQDALKSFDRALEISRTDRRLIGKEALTLNNYGFWARELGNTEQSLELFQRALEIDTELGSQRDIAYDQRNLAYSIIIQGNLTRAEELMRSSLAISQELRIGYNTIYCLFGLGEIYLRRREFSKALEYFKKSFLEAKNGGHQDFMWKSLWGQARSLIGNSDLVNAEMSFESATKLIADSRPGLRTKPSLTGLVVEASPGEVLNDYMKLLLNNNRYEKAFLISEVVRQRLAIDQFGHFSFDFENKAIESLVEKEKELRDLLDVTQAKILATAEGFGNSQKLRKVLEATTTEYEKIVSQLKISHPEYYSYLRATPSPVNQILKDLRENAGILSFWIAEENIFVFILKKGQFIFKNINIKSIELFQNIEEFLALINHLSSVDLVTERLSETLIKPISEDIRGLDHLTFIPHLWLNKIPFAALNWKDGPMLDDFEIAYSPDVQSLTKGSKLEVRKSAKILAFSSPILNSYNNLPFSAKETQSIRRYFDQVSIGSEKNLDKNYILDRGSEFEIVHLALHGNFDRNNAERSSLILSDHESKNLSVEDIFTSKFRGNMVVLSGCETGSMSNQQSHDLFSFSRALKFRGAKAVISSLWRINDVSTAVLMKRFYRNLSEGNAPSKALQRAQQIVRQYFPHPVFWAGIKIDQFYGLNNR